ncbi:MAG: DNA polymerase I [Gemmatimonadaceae bacterium]|nr:DNA polymerase I [Gemmatimonadaceae bacterium]
MDATLPPAPRLFLVDGYALVYRAFHAAGNRPLATRRGENTAIPWGIANFLDRVRRVHHPELLGWVHDAGLSSREAEYADYKANRVALEAAAQQDFDRGVERVEALLRAQRIPLLEVPGFEADDVIATLTDQAVAAGLNVVVVSPDKDLVQLVRPGVWILNPYHGRPGATTEKWYDLHTAHERLGVPPHQVVDYLALVGDASDNVPGVAGIGDKGAAALLAQWGSLDAIYANLDQVTPPRAQKALRAAEAEARLSYSLATVKRDVPIALDVAALQLDPPDLPVLKQLYVELEFTSLLARLPKDGAPAGVDAVPVPAGAEASAPAVPAPPADREVVPLDYRVADSVEAVLAVIAACRAAGVMAVDTETVTDVEAPVAVDPLRATLVGLSIAVAPGQAWYLPFAHRTPGGGQGDLLGVSVTGDSIAAKALAAGAPAPVNLPPFGSEAMAPLRALLEDPAVAKIGQNAKYDLLVLRGAGVRLAGLTTDTMLASYVLDPGRRSHGLDLLALELLGHEMTSYEQLVGKGKTQLGFDVVPIAEATAYSCEDADMTRRLADLLVPKLGVQAPLFRDVEMPLVEVLAAMEWEGIAIDLAWFAQLKARFAAERTRLEAALHEAAGETFNVNSTPQLRRILFEKLGLPVLKKTATGASTDASVLEELAAMGHELPSRLMEYREVAKLESTYLDALPKMVHPRTGRLHTSFNQTGSATGRLASSDPNLQNIPVRSELGREIRRGFVPRAGWVFLAADYSQIELRLLAHLSGDPAFVEAFRAGGDIHRQTAAIIFGVPLADVTAEMRARAKTINFATIYGQGAHALSRQLKIEHAEAKQFITTYFERFAGVRAFLDGMVEQARGRGYVETIFGRRRYIPELGDKNFNIRAFGERVAQNAPIQGSAADLIKVAMIRLHQRLGADGFAAKMLLQVHDELVFEVPPDELDRLSALVKTEMEGAASLAVPLVVELGSGATWVDAK